MSMYMKIYLFHIYVDKPNHNNKYETCNFIFINMKTKTCVVYICDYIYIQGN